ncbi:MAG: VanZ family protein [Porticoccaceae bacterium]|nr:VanZ family protein [Porticoccaceae bacterium]
MSHTVTYIYLFCLGWWGWFFNRNCWPLALLLLGYGIAIELLQSLTGYRSMEMFDLMANVAGIGLGWLLIKMIGHRLRPDR